MKKVIILILVLLILGVGIVSVSLTQNSKNIAEVKEYNKQYERYLNQVLWGTDVTSIINKAVNSNVKNKVTKDENGFFLDNKENSIKIEINMITEEGMQTYQMETIQKVGMEGFIQNFNLDQFKCSKIEYHKQSKMVSKIIFEQLPE